MKIGEIKQGNELGKSYRNAFVWLACVDCGKERWVRLEEGTPRHTRCHNCNQAKLGKGRMAQHHHLWKGGRSKTSQGYVLIRLYPDDFFYPMAQKKGYVLEHRLIVAKALGRCLQGWEIVHHKHTKYPAGSVDDKQDNRYPENLQIVSDLGHKQLTMLEEKIDKLLEKQDELMKELRLLRFENKQLKGDLLEATK